MSKWKDVGAGVQMWMLTAEVETEDATRSFSETKTGEKDLEGITYPWPAGFKNDQELTLRRPKKWQ